MTLSDLSAHELAGRLRGRGVPLRCGPLMMRIGTSLAELVEPIRLLYGDFVVGDDRELPDFYARVEPVPRWRSPLRAMAETVVDGRAVFDAFPRAQALPMLEWVMNWCLFTRPHQYLLLHAAVVEQAGQALLLSGEPGAGKSTLTAALVSRGWRLFSDELAVIPPGTRQVVPLPRPIGLKDASIDVIRRDAPRAVIGPPTPDTRKGTVAHVRPPADSVIRTDPAVPRWILFPRFEMAATPEVRRVSRADALLRLGDQAFNYSILGLTGFAALADVVDGCDCFEVRYGNLEDALTCVETTTGVDVPPVVAGRVAETR